MSSDIFFIVFFLTNIRPCNRSTFSDIVFNSFNKFFLAVIFKPFAPPSIYSTAPASTEGLSFPSDTSLSSKSSITVASTTPSGPAPGASFFLVGPFFFPFFFFGFFTFFSFFFLFSTPRTAILRVFSKLPSLLILLFMRSILFNMSVSVTSIGLKRMSFSNNLMDLSMSTSLTLLNPIFCSLKYLTFSPNCSFKSEIWLRSLFCVCPVCPADGASLGSYLSYSVCSGNRTLKTKCRPTAAGISHNHMCENWAIITITNSLKKNFGHGFLCCDLPKRYPSKRNDPISR